MREAKEILRLAREMIAGTTISIQGFNPLNLGEIEYKYVMPAIAKAYGRGWNPDMVSVDGSSNYSGFVGTINVYAKDEQQEAAALKALRDVLSELAGKNIKTQFKMDYSRLREMSVVRFDVRSNPEAKYEKLGQTELHITYTTWGEVLEAAGLADEFRADQAGDAPAGYILKAMSSARTSDPKVSRMIDVVLKMALVAKKLGYKSISWG